MFNPIGGDTGIRVWRRSGNGILSDSSGLRGGGFGIGFGGGGGF